MTDDIDTRLQRFIARCKPDMVADGESTERAYVIHMPYGSRHMDAYDSFWDEVNMNYNAWVESCDNDFPRVFMRLTETGEHAINTTYADYVG